MRYNGEFVHLKPSRFVVGSVIFEVLKRGTDYVNESGDPASGTFPPTFLQVFSVVTDEIYSFGEDVERGGSATGEETEGL